MRISSTRPKFESINWEELALESSDVDLTRLNEYKDALAIEGTTNAIIEALYKAGMKQKTIGKLFGVSIGTISLRLRNLTGAKERIPRTDEQVILQIEELKDKIGACPHSEYLEDTLAKFQVSPRKIRDILFIYVDTYPEYDEEAQFFELLRANRVSDKKAQLIVNRFFLKSMISPAEQKNYM
jgi:hypothetical protein